MQLNFERRVYDGMDIVQERDQNNVVTASLTRAGNIGGILARTTSSGSVFYGYDGSGNVTTLANSAGAEVGSYTYDAWGNTVATSGTAASENPYRFSTKESIGGLYSYGLRFYSPGLGRWINRDPMGEDGGANLYGFVENDPVNSADSYGLAPVVPVVLISPFTGKREYTPNGINMKPLMMPPGVDIMANIKVAESHRGDGYIAKMRWFYSAVNYNAPWDYKAKPQCPYSIGGWSDSIEDFGNFHYGVVGRAAGINGTDLLRAAGAAQLKNGTGKLRWGFGANFDDPDDQEMIYRGIKWYSAYQGSRFFNRQSR